MEAAGMGPASTHYGNNVLMPRGMYTVDVERQRRARHISHRRDVASRPAINHVPAWKMISDAGNGANFAYLAVTSIQG